MPCLKMEFEDEVIYLHSQICQVCGNEIITIIKIEAMDAETLPINSKIEIISTQTGEVKK